MFIFKTKKFLYKIILNNLNHLEGVPKPYESERKPKG